MTFKEKVFYLIDNLQGTREHLWNRRVNGFLVLLIVLSITSIILESFPTLMANYSPIFRTIEVVTVAIFSLEYILRLWTADIKYPNAGRIGSRLKFMLSWMGLVDMLAVLPFYLPYIILVDLRFVRILRIMRLLSIFKLKRYSKAFMMVSEVFSKKQSELSIAAFITLVLLLFSSTIMYHVEHEVQPDKFPDIISTLWWAVATLTTVGYGDVYPITGWGKLVAGVISLLGIGLVALPTGIISAAFVEELSNARQAKEEEAKSAAADTYAYCPHCGKQLPH
ncbi:MAG: ion transporter [Saprospiraceae bacterium]|nr:ion transporter [Saprospiraceae bacterium]